MQRALTSSAVLGTFLIASTSCVERILQVRSDPSGAVVYVNGEEVGTTPMDRPFTFYGTVEVALRAKGHFSHRELKVLEPPWYEMFPLDLFSEMFVPWRMRDVHAVEVILKPSPTEVTEAQRADLEKRSAELRVLVIPPGQPANEPREEKR